MQESLNISDYIDMAKETRRGAEHAGIHPQIEQLPIFGLTKDALFALRYRLDDGQVSLPSYYMGARASLIQICQSRRLQLRMQNPTDCQQIVSLLRRRGLEFQEPRPRTSRPDTAMTRSEIALSPYLPQSTPTRSSSSNVTSAPGRPHDHISLSKP